MTTKNNNTGKATKSGSSAKSGNTAKKIGVGLAHVQAFMDDVFQIGFKALKNVGKENDSGTEKIKSGLKKAAGFLGDAGDSYYDKYEKIKAKRAKHQNKKKV